MRYITLILFVAGLTLAGASDASQSSIVNFERAKIVLNDYVYHDRRVTAYCGCDYTQHARTGGRVDHDSCGYIMKGTRGDSETRAARIEYEHIMPISKATEGRSCGARTNCRNTDFEYNLIEADPHNLTPVIGEINALRSNFDFAELDHISFDDHFGACDFKVDRNLRLAEPADESKGFIARTYFYMAWAYGALIPVEKQKMLLRWHEAYPADAWEVQRNSRIAQHHGWSNPYITGEATWTISGERLSPALGIHAVDGSNEVKGGTNPGYPAIEASNEEPPFVGNQNSGIYFPRDCHWYNRIGESNRVPFGSESEAQEAGFRAAKNC